MDLKLVKNLLQMISESDVNEVSIQEGDLRIRIKKTPDMQYSQAVAPAPVVHPPVAPVPATAVAPAPAAPAAPAAQVANGKQHIMKSPIVGTFYRSPSPEAKKFVEIGDTVQKGSVLCIVEAMKIMNEIESDAGGKIVQILVQNASPVEYDQPLFVIETA